MLFNSFFQSLQEKLMLSTLINSSKCWTPVYQFHHLSSLEPYRLHVDKSALPETYLSDLLVKFHLTVRYMPRLRHIFQIVTWIILNFQSWDGSIHSVYY